jgi:RNA polymerase sigma factor (sigma-70 family)
LNFDELFRRAQAGDKTAEASLFAGLSDRFHHSVHHTVWETEDAKEIVQEALMAIAKELPRLEINSSFAAWAHKVLQNRVLSYLKTKKGLKERFKSSNAEDEHLSPELNPDMRRQFLRCLEELLSQNQRYARVLSLHYEGYSQAEICEALSLTPNAYYVLLSRARSMLRGCLDRNGWQV